MQKFSDPLYTGFRKYFFVNYNSNLFFTNPFHVLEVGKKLNQNFPIYHPSLVSLSAVVLFCLAGAGICLSFYAFTSVIPKYFQNDMNTAFGFISAVGAIGMMVLPPVVQFLIQQYGWRSGMLLLGALNANCIVCGLLIRPRLQIEHVVYTQLTNDNADNTQNQSRKFVEFLSFIFKDRPKFIIIILAEILAGIIYAGWVIFLVSHAQSKGVSDQLAAFLSSSGALGVIAGRLMMGPIIQNGRLTAVQLYIILACMNAVVFFLDTVSNNFTSLAINAFFNGLAIGTLIILSFGASAEVLGDDLTVEGYSLACVFFPIGAVLGGAGLGKFKNKENNETFLRNFAKFVVPIICSSLKRFCSDLRRCRFYSVLICRPILNYKTQNSPFADLSGREEAALANDITSTFWQDKE